MLHCTFYIKIIFFYNLCVSLKFYYKFRYLVSRYYIDCLVLRLSEFHNSSM